MEWVKKNKWFFVVVVVVLIVIYLVTDKVVSGGGNDERKFVSDTGDMILDYLKNYGSSFSVDVKEYSFKKCNDGRKGCDDKSKVAVYFYRIGIHRDTDGKLNDEIKLSNLLTSEVIHVDDYINPSNGLNCFDEDYNMSDGADPVIYTYKDTNENYYYYVDLSGKNLHCKISKKNGFISNMPDEMINTLIKEKVELPEELKNREV